ncbi:MAG: polyphosphate kinase 2 family protein [Candidatus Acidiferrales bacterium]
MKPGKFAETFRITQGSSFRLKDSDPGETLRLKSKEQAQKLLEKGIARLRDLQEKLYAQDLWALLLIFQGMDAAGKDSTIEHVMSGVNPQGCQVYSFKAPSVEELNHDFLWRATRCLPERGRIGIFNRSYYEEVLVVRVHRELLASERLAPSLLTQKIWDERFEDINAFERHLSRNGVALCKFFLHISRKEQKERFLSRLDEPEKNWKFSLADVRERQHWGAYMRAYEEMIQNTSTKRAPWYVVPADHKWFTRLVVAEAITDALEELDLAFPKVDAVRRKELGAARETLKREK